MSVPRKLTPEQEQAVQAMYRAGGVSLRALGDLYGVSPAVVLRAVNPALREKYRRAVRDWEARNPEKKREYSGRYYQKRVWGTAS
jgi:hypothetical protein